MKRLSIHQFGDTLIEVFFAMAVLSAVLSGAYVAASRALQLGRLAQERGEATKLVEAQIERMKYLASQKHDTTFQDLFSNGSNPMCIQADATVNPAACPLDSNLYTVSVYNETDATRDDCRAVAPFASTPQRPDQFLICAVWVGPGNFGDQEVGIHYRVH